MTEKLLDQLDLPKDLKTLSESQLKQLSDEIRERLLEVGARCGGHLASNLGVVELTIALHALFDSPKDKILWDTSHQCYVHKILTGRLKEMFTIRQDNGLSGFAKRDESDHDIFGAGHASTALSASLGVAHARDLSNDDYHVVSVFGDASLSGGMAFEALNNISKLNSNIICILNDNDMSISRPVGNMADYMTKIRTSNVYTNAKKTFEHFVGKIPKIGDPLVKKIERTVELAKDIVLDTKVGVIFEEFGFKYIGPIDGHDLPTVMAALRFARNHNGPILIHCLTKKGKGHLPAENDPVNYHGIKPTASDSRPAVQKTPAVIQKTPKPFTTVFGETVVELAQKDPKVVVITPAMKEGSGLNAFADAFPDRFFDVGIAEEHAVTFAAGLAVAGIKPILAIYSTFLQRGFDQLVHDVCLQQLPVIFALDRAGLVGEDGPTHHGVLDYNFSLSVPNLTVLAPKDGDELSRMLHWSITQKRPISIRYPKAACSTINGLIASPIDNQNAEVLFDTKTDRYDLVIAVAGSLAWQTYDAAKVLDGQGKRVAVINLRFIKPLDTETLSAYAARADNVLVIEEGQSICGIAAYIQQQLGHLDLPLSRFHRLGIPDQFITHGKISTLHNDLNLSIKGIIATAQSIINQTVTQKIR